MQKKRIAILSHFDSFQAGYALHVGWLERARLMKYFEQDFDFLVNTNCPADIYPNQKNCLTKIKTSRPFKDQVDHFADLYLDVLDGYDFIMTADLVYQRKGSFLAQNAAQRIAAPDLGCHWLQWIHSSWTTRPMMPVGEFDMLQKPERLRYIMPPKSTIIYLNSIELDGVMQMYQCGPHEVYPVYNPKDFRSFNNMHELSWLISVKMKFWEKDAIMLFPFCATRMDAKGFDVVAHMFAAFKRKGMKVALIFAVANSRGQQQEIAAKDKMLAKMGLIRDEDYMWTYEVTEKFRPLPRQCIADLFKMSNVFVWASWRETVGNVFQEAKISGNFMVLSNGLPSNQEMGGGPNTVYFPATHKTPGVKDGRTGDLQLVHYLDRETRQENPEKYFDELTDNFVDRIPTRKHQWQFSYEWIWQNQLEPLLYKRTYDEDGNFIGVEL